MTSRDIQFAYFKNLNISKTKRDCEKLKTPFRPIQKCCSVVFKIGSKTFSLQWHFKVTIKTCSKSANIKLHQVFTAKCATCIKYVASRVLYPGKLFKEIFSLHKLGLYIIFCLLFQVITEYIYELLQSDDVGLKKLEIPSESSLARKVVESITVRLQL